MHALNATHAFILRTMLLLMNKDMLNIDKEVTKDLEDNNAGRHCYIPYGCYTLSYPWTDEIHRPISLYPESPGKINPEFCLKTKVNTNCQNLNFTNLCPSCQSKIIPRNKTYLITHGFLDNGKNTWIKKMTRELFKQADCNVVIIDWSHGSGLPYPQAVANIRLIGDITAYIINDLVKVGILPEDIHIIGHGLGAHLAAYAGQTVQERFHYKIGRITGLDPAEPHFSKTDPVVRLDPTDANFVDVIHTDSRPFISGGLGIAQPIGHVDFYPNGGIQQPGCCEGVISLMMKDTNRFCKGFQQMISCNHIRSYQYFIESINPGPCSFMGTECSSWEEFQNGTCFNCSNNTCPFQTLMGMHADSYLKMENRLQTSVIHSPPRAHVSLFLMTGMEKPFCRQHFHISLKISNSCKSQFYGGEIGMISFTIQGDKGIAKNIKLTEQLQYYEPGSTYNVIITEKPIGEMESAILHWEYRIFALNPFTWRLTSTPKIFISWIQIKSVELGDSLLFCSNDEDVYVTSQKPLKFNKQDKEMSCNRNTSSRKISDCKDKLY